MNGLKCYFTRDQVKKLIEIEIEKKLDPRQLLGECSADVELCDDGRVEVTFWKCDETDVGFVSTRENVHDTHEKSHEAHGEERPRLVVNSPNNINADA